MGHEYAWVLFALWLLFLLRVLGQVLVMFTRVSFLPRKEEWFSGLMPYPQLLASQVIILCVYGKVWLDLFAGKGWFAPPSASFGRGLLKFGCAYLGLMILRYILRMGLYPKERWVGGCIPIFFHWVLSLFLVVLGLYNLQGSSDEFGAVSVLRALGWGWCAVVVPALAIWSGYMVAPSIVGWRLGLQRPLFAVRAEKHRASNLLIEVFRPYGAVRTSTLLFPIEMGTSWDRLREKWIGKLWAERGYTVVVVRPPCSVPSASQWVREQDWFNGEVVVWPVSHHRLLGVQ